MGGDRYTILFEVFKELFQSEEISVFELRERLKRKGLLPDENSVRKFYYYIQKLEEEGFAISERRGKKKYLKPLLGTKNSIVLGSRWSGFITFLLLALPNVYRHRFGEELKKFSEHLLGFDLTKHLSGDFFLREMVFLPQRDLFETLGLLVKALRHNWIVSALLVEDKAVKFVPKHLHFRDGKIYILGPSPEGDIVKLRLDYIKALTAVGREEKAAAWAVSPELLYESNEKPFVFGIAFHRVYMHAGKNDPDIIFPTQYYAKMDGEYHIYYLLGFTGDRFAQKFLTILYDEIIEPRLGMLKMVDLIGDFYPKPPHRLEENEKRFLLFLETLEKHLDLRNAIVKRKKLLFRD